MTDAALVRAAQGTDFAAALAAPPLTNLRRIGGEMFAWTDRDPRRGPARPRGAVLRHLLAQFVGPGRRVLIAGPHADDLVSALTDGGATVSWLLRSLGDAEETARSHPAVTVLAGTAARLDPLDTFDLVVAADGVTRLNSLEGEQLTADELLDRLAGAVRPDGALVLMHDNHFGLHHTVRLEPAGRDRTDAAWYPIDEHDPHRPASRTQLTDRLTEAGLTVDVTYAAFPEPSAPTVLIGPGLLGNVSSPLRPRLGTALSQAFAAAYRGRPVLSDPRRLVHRALRAGAEDAVAPAWLLIARAPGDTTAAVDPRDPLIALAPGGATAAADPLIALPPGATAAAGGHDLLIGDVHGSFAYEMKVAQGVVRTAVLSPLQRPAQRGGLRRIGEPAAPGADTGYVLEDRLLHLAATADLRGLRAELARFDGWLCEQARDGKLTGPVALAGLADVFVTGDGPALLPTRWEPIEPVPLTTARTRAAWDFAVQLITSGRPHPWPVTSSAVDLTGILLGMVGRGVAEHEVRAAVDLHVALESAEHDLTLSEQQERRLRLLTVTPGTAAVDVAGFRELTEALWRQRYQASHLLAMMEWTEGMIQSRDIALSKMDLELQFYRRGLAGKLLMIGKQAYRAMRRDGGKFLRGARSGPR
jgi:hypothetical protein